jgi:hypothetical protein
MSIAEQEAAERKMAIIEATAGEIEKSLELQRELEKEVELLKKKAVENPRMGNIMALAATKTGENKDLSDEDYRQKYNMSRQEMTIRAGRTTEWSTKQDLKAMGDKWEDTDEAKDIATAKSKINGKSEGK